MVEQDGTVLEGIVDLIYRKDDGSLVVVDYKTDHAPDAALPSRTQFYAPQVNAYRTIVRTATQEPANAPILVFARQGEAGSVTVAGFTPSAG